MSSNYHKQYMQDLQNKVDYVNNINASNFDFSNSGYRNTFYNNQENGLIGNRPNKSSDYTSFEQRISNSMSNISSNAYKSKKSSKK